MIHDHLRLLELADEWLEPWRVVWGEVQLDRQPVVTRQLPELAQLGLAEGRQTVGLKGVDACGHNRQPFGQRGQLLHRAGPVAEDEQRALEPTLADGEAVFEIAVVVLIRLGMHHHGKVHARGIHELEEKLRRGGQLRLVSATRVIGKTRVCLASEAMRVGVHDRSAVLLRFGD